MKTQMTVRGKTVATLLKNARIAQMEAGNWEVLVMVPVEGELIARSVKNGWGGQVLLLTNATHPRFELALNPKTKAQLRWLEMERDQRYLGDLTE